MAEDLENDIQQDSTEPQSPSPNLSRYMVKGLSRQYQASVQRAKIIAAIVGGILILFLAIFLMASVIAKDSKLSIGAEQAEGSITLSETIEGFSNPSNHLYAPGIPEIDNVDGRTLPSNLTHLDGSNNGENYFAYTFYLKNVGKTQTTVTLRMDIVYNVLNMADCMRIILYSANPYTEDMVRHIYAAPAKDGSQEYFHYALDPTGETQGIGIEEDGLCESFASPDQVAELKYVVKADDILKFTLIIYMEGGDNDCTNEVQFGGFGLSVVFTI